ncbi:extracellular calcium-sensing receptor-like [Protopterus annectens]|uniref:extracellular calcium-sensing receptor-like n=1 Tax=Protopterus annectens TaxID=7888 RepID=UPI001CFA429A|nr:extracellular calcium-sensing receptor-like [Protopterus annectens]
MVNAAQQRAAAVAKDVAATSGGPVAVEPLSATEEFLVNQGSQASIIPYIMEVGATAYTAEECPGIMYPTCHAPFFDAENEIILEGLRQHHDIFCPRGRQMREQWMHCGQTLSVMRIAWASNAEHTISYGSTVALLSNRKQFPSFFRTAPNDKFQSIGIARLMIYFGWTWVGILVEESDYGQQGSQTVKEELLKSEACIAFFESIPVAYSERKIQRIIDVIKGSSANVILAFSIDEGMNPVLEVISKHNITNKIWLASDGWFHSPIFSNNNIIKTLNGTIGFAYQKGEMPNFKEHLLNVNPFKTPNDIFVKEFWKAAFSCKLWQHNLSQPARNTVNEETPFCSGNENLKELSNPFTDISSLTMPYKVYQAVFAAAEALHDMFSCSPGYGILENGSCHDMHHFDPWQLLTYLKKVHFRDKTGDEIFFDINGDPPAVYDILNWQVSDSGLSSYVEVGRYNTSASPDLVIDEHQIKWNGGHTQVPRSVCSESCHPGYRRSNLQGQPKCCYTCMLCPNGEITNQSDSNTCWICPEDYWSNPARNQCLQRSVEYLSFEEPLGSTLASLSIICTLIPVMVLTIFMRHRDTPVVKANNRNISYLLLFALSLCFLCSLIFIGHPVRVTCLLRQTTFGIVFSLCISCVLAKTVMVVIAFNATKPNSNLKKWVGPVLPNSIVFICTMFQVILCICWLTISPPFPVKNRNVQHDKIIIECDEGSGIAFWFLLGYMGLLASVSFVVAFLARKLPDTFNEAQFITFSMLIFVSVWLSFIPAYLSTKGKYMVAVEIFAILSSSAGLFSCLFLPKCYIILLRPEMNTREYLMGKGNVNIK